MAASTAGRNPGAKKGMNTPRTKPKVKTAGVKVSQAKGKTKVTKSTTTKGAKSGRFGNAGNG